MSRNGCSEIGTPATAAEEMAAFDRLHRPLRDHLNYAEDCFSAVFALELVVVFGPAAALSEMRSLR